MLVGSFSDSFESVLQQLPADLVASGGCDSREPIECPEPVGDRWSEYIRFPSVSVDTGSFNFGWRGLLLSDAEAVTAIGVLLRYLTEDASSPLRQRFVERTVPLSGSLYAYLGFGIPSPVAIKFDGVPYIDPSDSHDDSEISMLFSEGYFENLLIQELQRLYDSRFDGNADARSQAAKEYRQPLAMELEDDPLQKLEAILIRDVIASHWSSSSEFHVGIYARVFDIIDKLIQKPVDFWLDLLKRFIDTRVYYIAAVPDTELGKKIEQERRDIEQRNAQSISDKDRYTWRIERVVEASKLSIPDELKRSIHIPDAQKIASLPHVHEVVELATPIGPAAVVQLIELETAFPALSLSISLPDLPGHLRPYLTLFRELVLATGITLPPGVTYDGEVSDVACRVSHTEFDRQLAASTVSIGARISKNTDLFFVDMRSTHESTEEASQLLIRSLLFADFTVERILTIAQNFLSEMSYSRRLGSEMIEEVTYYYTTQNRSDLSRRPRNRTNIFDQKQALKSVIETLDSGDTSVVDRLNELQRYIVNRAGGFWTFTSSYGQRKENMRFIDKLAQDWQGCFGCFLVPNADNVSGKADALPGYPFPYPRYSRFPRISSPLNIQVAMPTLHAAVVRICCE
ncbi:hypothetical protein EC988_001427 [Linderina pennispora]|nr:hypothetical protein EC988_001427 [Linderina pennispora]